MSQPESSQLVHNQWGTDDSGSHILHIDMDAFFASVELLAQPQLIGKPVIVGGSTRSVVVSATYEARAFGVRAGMPMAQARALCRAAVVVPPQHEKYQYYSQRVMEILSHYSALVEQVSVDEAFLDVSGARRQFGSPVTIAGRIQAEVAERLKLPNSIGVGPVKSVAKICSGLAKPHGIMLVSLEQAPAFMQSLPIKALWGVGPATEERLATFGITRVIDLLSLDRSTVEAAIGKSLTGRLLDLAHARDSRPVVGHTPEQSVGAERTFERDITDRVRIRSMIRELSDLCGQRVRAKSRAGTVVSIKIRDEDFTTVTRSRTLPRPTSSTQVIHDTAAELFAAWDIARRPIRLLGVRLEGLQVTGDEPEVVTLEEALGLDEALDGRAEQAMDSIRAKFGPQSVRFGGT